MLLLLLHTVAVITCGMISPNTTIPSVAPITATRPPPPVKASSRIVSVLFTWINWDDGDGDDIDDDGDDGDGDDILMKKIKVTKTLPRRIEQRRKLPIARIGIIA